MSGDAGAPLFEDVARRAAAYLKLVPERQLTPSTPAVDALQVLSTSFPELPISADDVIEWLDRVGSPATVATGGRYFGFVNGGALPAAVAASWLVSAWDQNAALRVMSPAAAEFEDVALEWVRDIHHGGRGGEPGGH